MAKGDPHWIVVKRMGKCANPQCARPIVKGDRAYYYPSTQSLYCEGEECGKKQSRDFNASNFDEQQYNSYERGY